MPIFTIGDPQLFTQTAHSAMRDPKTGLHSADNFWDLLSLRPESLNAVTHIFTEPVALPDGYRHMSSFAINAFKLINKKGQHVYVKFSWFPDQGERNLNVSEAERIAGKCKYFKFINKTKTNFDRH